ncbi:unnamed protein product [Zymoseptoria tritici ST99CH_3D1]|nr:unnamed protein product [Zymoseptoria tritici ST99CH_3D1]
MHAAAFTPQRSAWFTRWYFVAAALIVTIWIFHDSISKAHGRLDSLRSEAQDTESISAVVPGTELLALEEPILDTPSIEENTPHEPVIVESIKTPNINSSCPDRPGQEDIFIIFKTGATELYKKLPMHLATALKCMPNYILVSNIEQDVGNYHVHNVLTSVTKETQQEQEVFRFNEHMEALQDAGQDIGAYTGTDAWNLDKWKFLPMYHRAWEVAPANIKWFVMIEADTTFSWQNFMLWTEKHDPTEELYLGGVNGYGDISFAHGGTGVVMSRPALEKLEKRRQDEPGGVEVYDRRWEKKTADNCCGDVIVAAALREVDILVQGAGREFQGGTMNSMDFHPASECTPSITFHHATPRRVDTLYRFEEAWIAEHGTRVPYTYTDLFYPFIEPYAKGNRSDWNSLSQKEKFKIEDNELSPEKMEMARSKEACVNFCVQREECLQWTYSPEEGCGWDDVIRLGTMDAKDAKIHYTSGWMDDRIEEAKKNRRNCREELTAKEG